MDQFAAVITAAIVVWLVIKLPTRDTRTARTTKSVTDFFWLPEIRAILVTLFGTGNTQREYVDIVTGQSIPYYVIKISFNEGFSAHCSKAPALQFGLHN